jgi:hypothetical protein
MNPPRVDVPAVLRIPIELQIRIVGPGVSENLGNCPDCGQRMSLHQPDENIPSRLLATCEVCERWYLILEGEHPGGELLIAELPAEAAIRKEVALRWFRGRGGDEPGKPGPHHSTV